MQEFDIWECYRYPLCKIKISVSEFVYRNKNIKRLMQDYSNLMSQLLTFNFKTRRTTNIKLGNVLTFMWIQHNKQNTKLFNIEKVSKRHSEKQRLWKIVTSLKSIIPYFLTTAFTSENLLSNAPVLTFDVFVYRKETKSSYNGSISSTQMTFFCILSLVL